MQNYLLVREETDPLHAGQDVVLLLVVGKDRLGHNTGDQVGLVRGLGAQQLLRRLLPRNRLLPVGVLIVLEEANVDEDLDELGETGVSQGATREKLAWRR